jgi:hypothetical protein
LDQSQPSTNKPSNKRGDGLMQHTNTIATNASIINIREDPASDNTHNHSVLGKSLPQPFYLVVTAIRSLNYSANPVYNCRYAIKTHARKNSKNFLSGGNLIRTKTYQVMEEAGLETIRSLRNNAHIN